MTPRGKKILIISVSLLAIGGVVGYILWKRKKDKDAETKTDGDTKASTDTANQSKGDTGESTSSVKVGGSSGGGRTADMPSDVMAFQKFANSKGWSPKLKEDGLWGNKTSSAWATWKTDYNKKANPEVNANTLANALSVAKSIGAPTFVWSGKTYVTATGKPYIDPAVIQVGDTIYAKTKLGGYAWYNGKWSEGQYYTGGSSFGNFYKDNLVGKVTKIQSDGIEVENTFKPMVTRDGSYNSKFWVYAPYVTKAKPTYVQP
jgi:hypothetical protein